MSAPLNFDLTLCFMLLGGATITGFQDGDACKAEMNADAYASEAGADGTVARWKINDPRGKITMTLLYGKPANIIAQTLHNLDVSLGQGVTNFALLDTNGTSFVRAGHIWVMKQPSLTVGRKGSPVEWVFESSDLVINHGLLRTAGGLLS